MSNINLQDLVITSISTHINLVTNEEVISFTTNENQLIELNKTELQELIDKLQTLIDQLQTTKNIKSLKTLRRVAIYMNFNVLDTLK